MKVRAKRAERQLLRKTQEKVEAADEHTEWLSIGVEDLAAILGHALAVEEDLALERAHYKDQIRQISEANDRLAHELKQSSLMVRAVRDSDLIDVRIDEEGNFREIVVNV